MTNSEALGYMIKAMKNLDYSEDKIKEMEAEMNYCFDMLTEEQAENIYRKF